MSLEERLVKMRGRLEAAEQSHVLRFWAEATEAEKSSLLDQLEAAFERDVFGAYERAMAHQPPSPDSLRPIQESRTGSAKTDGAEKLAEYTKAGLALVAEGRVGVILLAGGQGTRLGFDRPKGEFDLRLPSGKSLFQLQAERILKVQALAGAKAPILFYVMTSPATRAQTEAFFQAKAFFGLKEEQVKFFDQGHLPCLDESGKLMLASKTALATAPDGNGGLYAALGKAQLIEDMAARGVEHLHVYCVDNCLVKVADPAFIGFAVAKEAAAAAKVVEKEEPGEKVGVICEGSEGRVVVVEYSEMTKEQCEARLEDGRLSFRAGNIANHYFARSFLQAMVERHAGELVPHKAWKKIPYVDESGTLIKAASNSGMKLELFVFDAFAFAPSFALWAVDRAEEFAPLKNADVPGAKDCPTTSRAAILAAHRRWLETVGARVEGEVELSPHHSYAGEGLEALRDKLVSQDNLAKLLDA